MKVKSFRDLEVWKKAMDLVDHIYDITDTFPKSELYGLTSQIRRSAVSIPSNIAEGSARNNTKELLQFLYIARGSLAELYTQLEIGRRRKFCNDKQYEDALKHVNSIGQMSAKLIQSLKP